MHIFYKLKCFPLFIFKDLFIYSERAKREAETQAEGKADSMQEA